MGISNKRTLGQNLLFLIVMMAGIVSLIIGALCMLQGHGAIGILVCLSAIVFSLFLCMSINDESKAFNKNYVKTLGHKNFVIRDVSVRIRHASLGSNLTLTGYDRALVLTGEGFDTSAFEFRKMGSYSVFDKDMVRFKYPSSDANSMVDVWFGNIKPMHCKLLSKTFKEQGMYET